MEDYIVIYVVVPKHIYETKLLTPEEKLIAERIIYLCKKEGYCCPVDPGNDAAGSRTAHRIAAKR